MLTFTSCDVVLQILQASMTELPTPNNALSNSEIIEGLKKALQVGADTAVTVTSKKDGYFGDKLLRISLPPEANVIVENISKIPMGKQMMDDVVLRLNRAAEDAAVEAKPILVNAITSMSITEGLTILKGKNPATTDAAATFDSIAATNYLRSTTYTQLRDAFKPKVQNSLSKKLVGNISTDESWTKLTTAFNLVAPLIGKEKVNTDLSGYVTERALDGLFLKVGMEEKKIRQDPFKWSVDILRKVFGSVMGQKN